MDSHSSSHSVIKFLITTLGAFLQLQYQSQKKSALEEQGNIMTAIYVNLFLYGMGLIAESKLKTCCESIYLSLIQTFTLLFGILVIVLIMIILNPNLGFVAFIIWALITMRAVIRLFQQILRWLCSGIENPSIVIQEILQWLRPIFSGTESSSTGIQENVSASVEANDFVRENRLSV